MIKPNFNPLFYSKYIFGLTKTAGSSAKEATSVGSVENNYFGDKAKAKLAYKKYMSNQKDAITKLFKEKGVEPSLFGSKVNQRAFKEFLGISAEMGNGYEQFRRFLNSPKVKNAKPEERKKLIQTKVEAMKKVFAGYRERVKEFHSIEKKRADMLKALDKQKTQLKSYFQRFFKSELTKEQQKKVVWSDLSKLIDAYMDRWVKENDAAINQLSGKQVKLLYGDLGGGVFARGILKKDVEEIKGQIHVIITDYWLEGREREVYKSPNWTDDFASLNDRRFGKERDMVPFPDGKDFAPEKGKKPYTSPLEEKYLNKLEKQEKEKINKVLGERNGLIAEFKKNKGMVEEFAPWKDSLAKLAKQAGYPKPYIPAYILQAWGTSERKAQYLPIMKREVDILKTALQVRKEFESVAQGRNSLAQKMKEKRVTLDEIKTSPLFVELGFNDSHFQDMDDALSNWEINKETVKRLKGVRNLVETVRAEGQLFKDVLSRIKEYKVSPQVVLNGSKLDVVVKGKDIPKPIQKKITEEFQGVLKLDVKSKYADTNVSLNGTNGYQKLLLEKFKSVSIPGRVKVENPNVTVKEEPKGSTAIGYASFDSTGYDFKRNHDRYALGRAKKLGVKGAKLVGKVMGVDKEGNSVEIDPKKGSAGVKESWKNLTAYYQKKAKEKKLPNTVKEEKDLRKLVADYNRGGAGLDKRQKSFMDHYFGQWRKAELDLTKSDKANKFEINVKFV